MTPAKNKPRAWSTMPSARGGIDAESITPKFEMERCELNARQLRDVGTTEAERRAKFKESRRVERGSDMVRRDRPAPVLKPSPRLASGPDRTSYNDRLSAEHKAARRAEWIAEAKAVRDELRAFRAELRDAPARIAASEKRFDDGDKAGAFREMRKLDRDLRQGGRDTQRLAKNLMRDVPDR